MENVVAGLFNGDKEESKTPGKNSHYKGGFHPEDNGIGICLYRKEETVQCTGWVSCVYLDVFIKMSLLVISMGMDLSENNATLLAFKISIRLVMPAF